MNQRFYVRNYDHDDRWYVFMGNEAMEAQGSGVLVREVGYRFVAEDTAKEYTRLFNRMLEDERNTENDSQPFWEP
jgi:hypothetical protein